MSDDEEPEGLREWAEWFWTTDHEAVLYARELVTSVAAVLAVGVVLFLISGVWPPMVAVESSSMEPNMNVGDLVFVMEEDRLAPEHAHETGVVTHRVGQEHGYEKFGKAGDVIIYQANGQGGTPIIHRAMFWVEEGENWCDEANPEHLNAVNPENSACAEAPHSGFITKGDNARTNGEYDQVNGLSQPVKPEWVVGTAELSIPFLGYVKLCTSTGPCFLVTAPVGPASATPGTGTPALQGGQSTVLPADRRAASAGPDTVDDPAETPESVTVAGPTAAATTGPTTAAATGSPVVTPDASPLGTVAAAG
jgi:signal peptidase